MFAASKTAAAAAGAPPATDPQFNYVTMLLHGDGTNGAQNNTFVDSSTNNFTITRNGTPTQGSVTPYWPDGQWSNQFSGSGQYLSVADNAAFTLGSGDWTIESWVYTGVSSGNQAIIGQCSSSGGANTGSFVLYASISGYPRIMVGVGSNWQWAQSSTLLPLNQWVHLAGVRNGTTVTIYVNGVSSGTYAISTNTINDSAFSVAVGRTGEFNGEYLNGYASNVRFVKGTALYVSNFTPSTTPLTAVSGTSLLTCQSNRFRDNSSNNFAITVTGTPTVQSFDPFSPAASYGVSNGGSSYFKGTTDFLTLADNPIWDLPGDFTVECYVYMIGAQNDKNFIVQYPGGTGGLSFGTFNSGNRLQFGAAGVAYDVTSTNAIPVYQWVHVAAVRSGTSLKLYINGVNDGTATQSRTYGGSAPMAIGGNSGSSAQCLIGYISNLRMVKGTAVYTSNFTPPTAPVTAITNTSLLLNFTNAGIYDAAVQNDLVTVGNAQVSTAQAKFGSSSMAFDGSGDYLTAIANSGFGLGTGDFTIEYWVWPTSVSNGWTVIDFRASTSFGDQGFTDYLDSGRPAVYYNPAASSLAISSIALTANAWNHVAFSRSSGTLRIFVNGVQGFSGSVTNNFGTSQPLGIGVNINRNQFWNGYMEDIRITKGYARYTSAFTPPTAPFPTR